MISTVSHILVCWLFAVLLRIVFIVTVMYISRMLLVVYTHSWLYRWSFYNHWINSASTSMTCLLLIIISLLTS